MRIDLKILLSVVIAGSLGLLAQAHELSVHSVARVQDKPALGANSGEGDVLQKNEGYLYVGDHPNNQDVFHVGYMFDIEGDLSNAGSQVEFVFSVPIAAVEGAGWEEVSLYHLPEYGESEIRITIVRGGELVSSKETAELQVGDVLEFDVTAFVLNDIENQRPYSTFRVSPKELLNNGNEERDTMRLEAAASLTMKEKRP